MIFLALWLAASLLVGVFWALMAWVLGADGRAVSGDPPFVEKTIDSVLSEEAEPWPHASLSPESLSEQAVGTESEIRAPKARRWRRLEGRGRTISKPGELPQ